MPFHGNLRIKDARNFLAESHFKFCCCINDTYLVMFITYYFLVNRSFYHIGYFSFVAIMNPSIVQQFMVLSKR